MCVSDEGGDNFGGGGQLEHTLFVGGFGCCCSSAAHLEEARRACPHTHVGRSEDSTKTSRPSYAVIDTAKGSITIEIYKDASADVVDRFVSLCKSNHFKGMPFRHVIKNFVIQGGDFDFNGAAQEWILKAKASGENALSPKHEAFMIGTTKNPNNKGFDLFITTAPIPDLNDKLVVFGQVINGQDIVQEIEEVDTDEHYQPKTPIGILNITLKQQALS
uniref:Peptidyl-prolyl cis-trans isomerase n=1 Tax=Oryza meridionalis TaxID=40149 RepID=A0A0E0EB61_9ORYZ